MSIYDEMQGVAHELLTEFDQGGLTYIRLVPGNGPPDNPGAPTQDIKKFAGVARGVSFKYIGTTLANGSLVVASDLQVTLPADLGINPDMADFVGVATVQHKIIQIIKLPATGTVVAYRLIIRR